MPFYDFAHRFFAFWTCNFAKNLYSLNEFINQALSEIATKQNNAVNDFFPAHKNGIERI
jgi:hypothetical protein